MTDVCVQQWHHWHHRNRARLIHMRAYCNTPKMGKFECMTACAAHWQACLAIKSTSWKGGQAGTNYVGLVRWCNGLGT